MYIAAYPIAVLRRQTEAVMKYKFLRKPQSKIKVLYKYWKSSILNNITWLYGAIVLLCYLELKPSKPEVSDFSIMFEVASAYGTVGYSMSYDLVTSLSGIMCGTSKIVIMATMLLGRHRGLPNHCYHKDMRRGVTQEVDLSEVGI
jgi:Trk-type K+ transport system membrane component